MNDTYTEAHNLIFQTVHKLYDRQQYTHHLERYCGVLRHCRHRLDGLILYSQSQSHVVTIPCDYFLHSYTLHCWLFSPWRLSPSGSNIYNSPTLIFQP
jgi:hypothetical protein